MQTYDFICAGGGVAALSLAYHLARSALREQRMLIVDQAANLCHDRTLSFWCAGEPPYAPIVSRSWDRLRLSMPGWHKDVSLSPYRYHTIRGRDFAQYVQRTTAASGATFLRRRVTAIEDDEAGALVHAGGEVYRARWVFDSRFDRAAFVQKAAGESCLWQHCYGWEIVTPQDCFEPGTATFMDLRASQHGEWRFFYVLPYTPRHALVELVSLRPEQSERAMQGYIASVLSIGDYQIVAREAGVTPLTSYRFPRRVGDHVMAIGIHGGRIKSSTGYGFLRMEADARAVVQSLQAHGHPFDVPQDRRGYRMLDALMLRTFSAHEAWALPLFSVLLTRNPLPRVLRFLDESASPADVARLVTSLLPETISLFWEAR